MYDTTPPPPEPSLVDSVIRIFEAGQRVVLDRVDLARFDLSQFATRALRGAALVAVGAVLLCGAWFTLMGGAVVWLQTYVTLTTSLVVVAVVSALLGVVAIQAGVRRAQAEGIRNELLDAVRGASNAANETDGARQQ